MTEEEILEQFEKDFEELEELTVPYDDMLEYISNLQKGVIIVPNVVGINISSISPVVKSDFGDVKLITVTDQGKVIVTEGSGVSIVTHVIDSQREYTITSGSDIKGLFETN